MAIFSRVNFIWKFGLGYSRLVTDGASASPEGPLLSRIPSLIQIATSKRLRLIAATFIAACIFLAVSNIPSASNTFSHSFIWNTKNPPEYPPQARCKSGPPRSEVGIDWSRFAYTQYATNAAYLCNSVMFFERLHTLGSKPERVLMYPASFDHDTGDNGKLLRKARDEYNVILVPIEIQRNGKSADSTWAESFTKLLAFNQTQYERVLSLDSDSTVLQPPDELFLLPPCPVAMPRAYWLESEGQYIFASFVILIEPSKDQFKRIQDSIQSARPNDYDMEIVDRLYHDSALIIPHRRYALLTREFWSEEHEPYLGNDSEEWDPVAVYNEAKYVHFSDWPLPKPWYPTPEDRKQELQPKCVTLPEGGEDCSGREIWQGIYDDFRQRRSKICG